jgi:Beta-ketoacyl synthase, N-terminal domain
MDGRGDRGESVAIIGMACRFPGARDPAEFHDLAVAGRDMFQPVAALPGRPLRAAVLDDWSLPRIADDPVTGGLWPDVGPVRKPAPPGRPRGAVSCGGAGNPARSVT